MTTTTEAIVQRIVADRGIANLPADEQAMSIDLIRCWVDEVLGAVERTGHEVR